MAKKKKKKYRYFTEESFKEYMKKNPTHLGKWNMPMPGRNMEDEELLKSPYTPAIVKRALRKKTRVLRRLESSKKVEQIYNRTADTTVAGRKLGDMLFSESILKRKPIVREKEEDEDDDDFIPVIVGNGKRDTKPKEKGGDGGTPHVNIVLPSSPPTSPGAYHGEDVLGSTEDRERLYRMYNWWKRERDRWKYAEVPPPSLRRKRLRIPAPRISPGPNIRPKWRGLRPEEGAAGLTPNPPKTLIVDMEKDILGKYRPKRSPGPRLLDRFSKRIRRPTDKTSVKRRKSGGDKTYMRYYSE